MLLLEFTNFGMANKLNHRYIATIPKKNQINSSIPKKIIEWDPSIQMWQLLLWKTFQKYFPSGLEIPKAHSGLNCENKFNFGNSQIKQNIVFKNNFELGSLKGAGPAMKWRKNYIFQPTVMWIGNRYLRSNIDANSYHYLIR